jgi:feruloyl esterase
MKSHQRLVLLSSVASVGLCVATACGAATCESVASLSLPNITITAAQTIPAGDYTAANGQTFPNLPSFCRVAATATPTSQSDIDFEVWCITASPTRS